MSVYCAITLYLFLCRYVMCECNIMLKRGSQHTVLISLDPQSRAHARVVIYTTLTLTTQPDTSLQLPRTTGNHLLYLSHLKLVVSFAQQYIEHTHTTILVTLQNSKLTDSSSSDTSTAQYIRLSNSNYRLKTLTSLCQRLANKTECKTFHLTLPQLNIILLLK